MVTSIYGIFPFFFLRLMVRPREGKKFYKGVQR